MRARAAAGRRHRRFLRACRYIEASAKTREGIKQAFEEVVQKILDTPKLMDEIGGGLSGLSGANLSLTEQSDSSGYCSYC